MNINRRVLVALMLLILWSSIAGHSETPSQATVYYNEACRDCTKYIRTELIPLFQELGIQDVIEKDFINDPANRAELVQRSTELGIPPNLQGHMTVFLDERIFLQGHVPASIIRDLVDAAQGAFEKILVFQDKMTGMNQTVADFQAWAFTGPIKTFSIERPISDYLDWFAQHREEFTSSENETWSIWTWIPLIVSTGLLDGINPCAFAVLLFFIAFLFTVHRIRAEVLKVGLVYIGMIYLTYLAIGLGILQAIVITDTPHFMAKAGSWLLIGLGFINIKDFWWYGKGFSLSPSAWLHQKSTNWLQKATMPATIVGGILVGLCTFPCSGGMYVAVLGLLSAKATYTVGFGYLLLYNVMFVLPLIAVLLAVGNRRTVGRLMRWETQNKRTIKLTMGCGMVSLGAAILLWLV